MYILCNLLAGSLLWLMIDHCFYVNKTVSSCLGYTLQKLSRLINLRSGCIEETAIVCNYTKRNHFIKLVLTFNYSNPLI